MLSKTRDQKIVKQNAIKKIMNDTLQELIPYLEILIQSPEPKMEDKYFDYVLVFSANAVLYNIKDELNLFKNKQAFNFCTYLVRSQIYNKFNFESLQKIMKQQKNNKVFLRLFLCLLQNKDSLDEHSMTNEILNILNKEDWFILFLTQNSDINLLCQQGIDLILCTDDEKMSILRKVYQHIYIILSKNKWYSCIQCYKELNKENEFSIYLCLNFIKKAIQLSRKQKSVFQITISDPHDYNINISEYLSDQSDLINEISNTKKVMIKAHSKVEVLSNRERDRQAEINELEKQVNILNIKINLLKTEKENAQTNLEKVKVELATVQYFYYKLKQDYSELAQKYKKSKEKNDRLKLQNKEMSQKYYYDFFTSSSNKQK